MLFQSDRNVSVHFLFTEQGHSLQGCIQRVKLVQLWTTQLQKNSILCSSYPPPPCEKLIFQKKGCFAFLCFDVFFSILNSFSSLLLSSLCRNPMCLTVTAKWLASCRTHWAGTAAPPCLSVALHPATMMQRPNPRWCLANGNMDLCVW